MIACDLGSNTLRIVEIDCEDGRRLKEFERMVKTADGLHETALINDGAVERIIAGLKEAKEAFDFENEPVYAVTTAAVRLAKNGETVLARIKEATGVRFIMIDAKEEAKLTSLAVAWRLKKLHLADDNYLLMDLGGGSTEITHKVGDKEFSASFNIGIVTIAQKYASADALQENVEKELLVLKEYIKNSYESLGKATHFVATAGTPTTIAAFKQGLDYAHYDVEKVNGTILEIADLDEALARIIMMDVKERERWVGVGRDDLIIAGVLIVKSIMISAEMSSMIVIDDGLREGLALQKCQENS